MGLQTNSTDLRSITLKSKQMKDLFKKPLFWVGVAVILILIFWKQISEALGLSTPELVLRFPSNPKEGDTFVKEGKEYTYKCTQVQCDSAPCPPICQWTLSASMAKGGTVPTYPRGSVAWCNDIRSKIKFLQGQINCNINPSKKCDEIKKQIADYEGMINKYCTTIIATPTPVDIPNLACTITDKNGRKITISELKIIDNGWKGNPTYWSVWKGETVTLPSGEQSTYSTSFSLTKHDYDWLIKNCKISPSILPPNPIINSWKFNSFTPDKNNVNSYIFYGTSPFPKTPAPVTSVNIAFYNRPTPVTPFSGKIIGGSVAGFGTNNVIIQGNFPNNIPSGSGMIYWK